MWMVHKWTRKWMIKSMPSPRQGEDEQNVQMALSRLVIGISSTLAWGNCCRLLGNRNQHHSVSNGLTAWDCPGLGGCTEYSDNPVMKKVVFLIEHAEISLYSAEDVIWSKLRKGEDCLRILAASWCVETRKFPSRIRGGPEFFLRNQHFQHRRIVGVFQSLALQQEGTHGRTTDNKHQRVRASSLSVSIMLVVLWPENAYT